MVFFNWATMQMAAKIVYYGPGLCGKTSNLSYIYAKTAPNSRGEMVSLETESDRTLFFDLLPIEVGTIGGFKTRLQLYTVPGQVFYNTTRKLVLKGVDGLVFVADSQRPMREANLESFESLRSNLDELGVDINDLPLVLQYNKRDLSNILALEELNSDLNEDRAYTFYESEAINGVGIFETLKEITKLTLKKLRKRMVAPHAAPTGPRVPTTQVRPAPASPKRTASVSAAALARAAEEGVDSNAFDEAGGSDLPEVQVSEAAAAAAVADEHADPAIEDSPFVAEASVPGPDEVDEPPSADANAEDPFAVPADESPFADDEQAKQGEPDTEFDPPLAEVTEDDTDTQTGIEPPESEAAEQKPVGLADENSDVMVEFDQTDAEASKVDPPPVKRVQLSNQMDILAELEGLRKQATMANHERRAVKDGPELDIDALLAGSEQTRELKRKVEQPLNSDVFQHMHGLQLAIRIQNADGETIHTLEPVSLSVDKAEKLKKLSLRFTVNLENHQ
jgi:signal recognition particle receptor subunit beta